MPIKRSEAFGEAFKQRKKNEEEVGFIESALAGVATGVINIPKTAFSLGAELIDLGLGTETAASVEKFFDDLNPFDDEAEARTVGRITTALTQLVPAGIFGAIKGAAAAPRIATAANNLAKRALQAKQTGKYFGTLDFATARFHTILIKLSQDSVLAIENKTAIQECFNAIQIFYKYTKKFQDTRVPFNFIYTPVLHFIGKTRIPKIKSLLKKLDN